MSLAHLAHSLTPSRGAVRLRKGPWLRLEHWNVLISSLSHSSLEHSNRTLGTVKLFVGEVVKVMESKSFASSRLDQLCQGQMEGGVYTGLLQFCKDGYPNELVEFQVGLHQYWRERDSITVFDGLLLKDHCIIAPSTLRKEMLELLGTSACKVQVQVTGEGVGLVANGEHST